MLNRLSNSGGESRAISFQSLWGAGDTLAWANQAGTNVTADSSLEIAAFFSAISLIADTISTLPVDSYIRVDGARKPYRPRPAWIDQPDVDQTKQAHYQQVLISLMVFGNSFTRVFRDDAGEIVNLVTLDPQLVDVHRNAIGRKIFIYKGEETALTSEDIIHITDMVMPGQVRGKARIDSLKDNLGLALALQGFAARFFGQGSTTAGIIEYPGQLTREQAKSLTEGFDARHRSFRNAHKTGVLSGGAKYVQTSVANDQSQFLQSREFAVQDICRIFNLPPVFLGVPGTTTYASIEQLMIFLVTHTLRPYIEKLEWSYGRLLPSSAFLKFNVDGLLRGDFNSRMNGYSIATQGGWMSINDIHKLEDMAAVDGGDVYRVPLANVDLKAASLTEKEGLVDMAKKLIDSGFEPQSVLSALGLPAMVHSGVPTKNLQPVAAIDPNDPASVYGAN
jgi:HK97 family phage portal protein